MREREIIFRGKRIDDNSWVHGPLVEDKWIIEKIADDDRVQLVEVKPETVGQFLGYDAHEDYLYEGDIVAPWGIIDYDRLDEDKSYIEILKKNRVFMVVKYFENVPVKDCCLFEGFGFTYLGGKFIEKEYFATESDFKKFKRNEAKLNDILRVESAKTWRGNIEVVGNIWDGLFYENLKENEDNEEANNE